MKQMCYSREWGGGGRKGPQEGNKNAPDRGVGVQPGERRQDAATQQSYVPHFSLNVFCNCRRVRSRSTDITSLPWLFSTGAPGL